MDENKILLKYRDLHFKGDDLQMMKIYSGNCEWVKSRGWHLLVAPISFKGDGTDDPLLTPTKIDLDLITLIELTEQPEELNVKIIKEPNSTQSKKK